MLITALFALPQRNQSSLIQRLWQQHVQCRGQLPPAVITSLRRLGINQVQTKILARASLSRSHWHKCEFVSLVNMTELRPLVALETTPIILQLGNQAQRS